jgi:hypothetical protein
MANRSKKLDRRAIDDANREADRRADEAQAERLKKKARRPRSKKVDLGAAGTGSVAEG